MSPCSSRNLDDVLGTFGKVSIGNQHLFLEEQLVSSKCGIQFFESGNELRIQDRAKWVQANM